MMVIMVAGISLYLVLSALLTDETCTFLLTLRSSGLDEGEDRLTCKWNVDAMFSIKSAYLQCIEDLLCHHVQPSLSKLLNYFGSGMDPNVLLLFFGSSLMENSSPMMKGRNVVLLLVSFVLDVVSFIEQIVKIEVLGATTRSHIICWLLPLLGFVNLNVDGYVYYAKGIALIWGLMLGLELASSMGVKRLMVEMNSKMAIKLLGGHCPTSHHCFNNDITIPKFSRS
ncbi:hypothetical protein RIF29_04031 [Crotalaria pallida]|uniref:RNase H type-1 domain-containing protein n=1 Tax=Crotalaria pallida TaxID=3830 RepID=A0AAN9J0L3_CROPI